MLLKQPRSTNLLTRGVHQVSNMSIMFYKATLSNQYLSTWTEKTTNAVITNKILKDTACPNGVNSPDATVRPWCQTYLFCGGVFKDELNFLFQNNQGKDCLKWAGRNPTTR